MLLGNSNGRPHDLGGTRASRVQEFVLERNPSNAYDAYCVDVCRKLLGDLEARVAAVVGPLMDRLPMSEFQLEARAC